MLSSNGRDVKETTLEKYFLLHIFFVHFFFWHLTLNFQKFRYEWIEMSGDVPIRNALFIDQSELKIEIDFEHQEEKFCCRKFISLANTSDQYCNETIVKFSI